MNKENLITRINAVRDAISRKQNLTPLDHMIEGVLMNCTIELDNNKPDGKCANECECWSAAYERGKLDTLKEWEALEPYTDSEGTCSCDNCGTVVGWYPVGCKTPEKLCKYCPECGRAVKWQ